MLIVILLKLLELNKIEFILFSVGFSSAFLMFTGLLTNELGYLLGLENPLTTANLMIVLNVFIVMFEALIFLFDSKFSYFFTAKMMFSLSPLQFLLIIALPILGIGGAITTSVYANSFLALLLIITISLTFAIGISCRKIKVPNIYPIIVFAVAISLLLSASFLSRYLISFASDNPVEHYLFRVTKTNGYWNQSLFGYDISYGRTNSMLSVTVLPTIYSLLLNMDDTWVMKILYPTLLAMIPLGLYVFWQKSVGYKRAFIAAFLLMADFTFYSEMLGLCRQIVAELFVVLLLMTIFDSTIDKTKRKLCLLTFIFGLVVSHYAIAIIFSFFISSALILLIITKRLNRKITLGTVIYLNVLMFLWYIYTSNATTFNSFITYGEYVYAQLGEFFSLESRGSMVLRGLGLEPPPTIWNGFSRVFFYVTELFIIIGFIGLIKNKRNLYLKVGEEHSILITISVTFLIILIVVPGLARTMNMTRFYHFILFFIAPLFILGIENILQWTTKRRKELYVSVLAIIVLVPYFLFQSGFIYEIVKIRSYSLPLSSYRMDLLFLNSRGYFAECDVHAALWLSKYHNINNNSLTVYADYSSIRNLLINYGMIYRGNLKILLNATDLSVKGIIYFNGANMIEGLFPGSSLSNITDYADVFHSSNIIYTNSISEILQFVEP